MNQRTIRRVSIGFLCVGPENTIRSSHMDLSTALVLLEKWRAMGYETELAVWLPEGGR